MTDPEPLKSPEARFMEEQLRDHNKNRPLEEEIEGLKKRFNQIDETFNTLTQTGGGKVALPYLESTAEDSGTSFGGGTVTINVFEDGVLTTKLVRGSSGSDFGPFA